MKNKIVEVMEEYNFRLTIDEDGGLIFEGPMSTQEQLDDLLGKLFTISKDLDVMLFQVDDDTLMLAVFCQQPLG